MCSLSFTLNGAFSDIFNTFFAIIIGFVIFKLSKFYLTVQSLPPGPLPLPILGNILVFRSKEHSDQVIKRVGQKYGPIFTIWLGNNPLVFISDIDIARKAFRMNEFAGRQSGVIASFLSNEKHQDVPFSDYGETWEALRRVAHSAAIKYSTNDKLLYLAADCVDSTFKLMIENEGINNEFKPNDYFSLLFLNIISSSAFGKNYSPNDSEFKKLNIFFESVAKKAGPRQGLWEFSALFRLLDRSLIKKQREDFYWLIDLIKNKYIDHNIDYTESIERDFCDALITAKNKALRENRESAPYLKDENLAMCVFDLFFGGYDTTQYTFQWILLFLCYYPEIQQKLRQEIEIQIGDRIPTHEDRNRCQYVMAFIYEVLRLTNAVPSGIPHKAVVNSKIGDYTIPEGTTVIVYQGMILTDEKYWLNAHEFKPERFLLNEELITTPKAFIPFSVGRRICLGEKLATAEFFLVLVRFLQLTSNYTIVLGQNSGIKPDSNVFFAYTPLEYKIVFKTK